MEIYRPENWTVDVVAFDVVDGVVYVLASSEIDTWGSLYVDVIGDICSGDLTSLKTKTTSDIDGLVEAGDWVHIKDSSMIFFTSCRYSVRSSLRSHRFSSIPFSYRFHAYHTQ